MSDTIVIEKIATTDGEGDYGPWVRTALKDRETGKWFSTFKPDLVAEAKEGVTAEIEYTSKKGEHGPLFTLTSFKVVSQNGGAPPPEAYTHQKPDGEADWDKVALGKTRCALWMHFLAGDLATTLYVKGNGDTGHLIRVGTIIIAAAEKDIFERPPGDDGIPFEAGQ